MDVLNLIEQVTTREEWPAFHDADRLKELDELAAEAFDREMSDGYLAYVLITHQVCDEFIRLLIAHTRFALRLMIAPNGFDIKFSTKEDNTDLNKLMTGQLIGMLEHSLEFEEKDEFLQLCRDLSGIRNNLAHQLARQGDLAKLVSGTEKYKSKYERAEELFFEAHDNFLLLYKDSRKDDSWDWILKEMVEDDGLEPDAKVQCERVISLRKAAGFGSDAH